jgi:tetratricopeptide (TPR) repeat protein
MLLRLWKFIRNGKNREILSWLGGGAVVIVTGMWALFAYLVPHDDKKPGASTATVVNPSGPVIAPGHDANFNAQVNFGLDEKQVTQRVAEAQKPLNDKIDALGALVQQLVANRSGPSTPGQEQAVATAVAAAQKGAAEGDAGLQQALDLLKANKIAEAETKFRAVADEKAARIVKDKKDAAAAYRNLGAIAGLRDPKKALDAYEKALEFDPDDVESLFRVGGIQVDRGYLEEAQSRLAHVFLLATDNQPFYQYWARLRLGDIRIARGDLTGALKSFRDGLAIADRLAKADPGNAGWQRDLSVSYDRVGDVLVAQGNLPEALKSFRDGLAIRNRLAKADPGNAGWQRDLSVSYDKIGDVLVAQGNLPEALKSFRDGLAIRDRLAKADPGNAGWQRDLSVSYAKLAGAFRKAGDKTKALDALRQGRAIMLRMTSLSPDNAVWKRDLAWLDGQIAELAR